MHTNQAVKAYLFNNFMQQASANVRGVVVQVRSLRMRPLVQRALGVRRRPQRLATAASTHTPRLTKLSVTSPRRMPHLVMTALFSMTRWSIRNIQSSNCTSYTLPSTGRRSV